MSIKPQQFSFQFDPGLFHRTVDQFNNTTLKDINVNIGNFVRNQVQEVNQEQIISGANPMGGLPASDIDSFGELLALAIKHVEELEGIKERDRLEVRESHQDIIPERDTLTWCLKKRCPGLMAAGRPGANHVKENTMHLRSLWVDPNNPGNAIAAFGQKMDNWIMLKINSNDSVRANAKALWLERVMDEIRWLFSYYGFERVLFEERIKDDNSQTGGDYKYKRCLVYYVRTEKITLFRTSLLRQLVFNIVMRSQENQTS